MTASNRPLSPHLQVYRPQLTSVLSILHRATGIVIAAGALLIAWWLWAIMSGPESYHAVHRFFNSMIGCTVLILWTGCTFYHLCSGVRHLFWDAGIGFELSQVYLTGKLVVIGAVGLTGLAWLL